MKPSLTVTGVLMMLGFLAMQVTDQVGSPPKEVTYCQLIQNPSSLVGKRIQVRAIYSYMFEVSRFKSPECCPERDVSIWVDFDENLDGNSKRLLSKFPKGMGFVLATFVGTLDSGGPFGGGGYRLKFKVDKIEKLERSAKGSAGHNPSWVPENCEATDGAQPQEHLH